MLIAFQIILLIVILVNGVGVKEEKDIKRQMVMAFTAIAILVAFMGTVYWV